MISLDTNDVHYRKHGGKWRDCIATTPHFYMVWSPVKASTNTYLHCGTSPEITIPPNLGWPQHLPVTIAPLDLRSSHNLLHCVSGTSCRPIYNPLAVVEAG